MYTKGLPTGTQDKTNGALARYGRFPMRMNSPARNEHARPKRYEHADAKITFFKRQLKSASLHSTPLNLVGSRENSNIYYYHHPASVLRLVLSSHEALSLASFFMRAHFFPKIIRKAGV